MKTTIKFLTIVLCALVIISGGQMSRNSAKAQTLALTYFRNTYTTGFANQPIVVAYPQNADGNALIVPGKSGSNAAVANLSLSTGAINWAKKIGGSLDVTNAVAKLPSGDIRAVGTTYNYGSVCKIFVSTLQLSDGSQTLFNTIGDDGSGTNASTKGNSITITPNGYQYIAGESQGFSLSPKCAIIVKLDSSGNLLDTKILGHWMTACSIVNTLDGNLAVAGTYYNSINNSDDYFLIIMDYDLNIIHPPRYYGSGSNETCRMLRQFSDSTFVLFGTVSIGGFGLPNGGGYFVRANAQGDTLHTGAFCDTLVINGYSIAEDNDGGAIVGGSRGGAGSGSFLAKVNKFGQGSWAKMFGLGSVTMDHNNGIITSPEGIIATGDKGGLFSILKADNIGNIVGGNSSGCDQNSTITFKRVSTITGIFTPVEVIVNPSFSTITGATTTNFTTMTTICSNVVTETPTFTPRDKSISIYPNPVIDHITVSNAGEGTILYFYDVFGRLVFQKTNHEGEEISVGKLPSGTYIVRIGSLSKEIVVIK